MMTWTGLVAFTRLPLKSESALPMTSTTSPALTEKVTLPPPLVWARRPRHDLRGRGEVHRHAGPVGRAGDDDVRSCEVGLGSGWLRDRACRPSPFAR